VIRLLVREVDAVGGQPGESGVEAVGGTVKKLDEASRIELGFPESMYAKELVRGFRYGGMREQIVA